MFFTNPHIKILVDVKSCESGDQAMDLVRNMVTTGVTWLIRLGEGTDHTYKELEFMRQSSYKEGRLV